MLGARMVDGRVDEELTRAARDVVAKIKAVLPKDLRITLLETPLFAPHWVELEKIPFNMADLREAIRREKEISIDYISLAGQANNASTCGPFPSGYSLKLIC